MKPVVVRSINDETGQRCVDIMRNDKGMFAFSECRRDPEDAHGWRHLSHAYEFEYNNESSALGAAVHAVHWLSEEVAE